jgi:SAM-dependent methyltransferase
MSDGVLAQAKARSSEVNRLKGPAEHLPFDDGELDAVVTTSAFHFFDQPAALREFHRVLAPSGVAAVATIGAPQPEGLQRLFANRLNPSHNPSPSELRELFETAGFRVTDQHPVRRPLWTRFLADLVTVGVKG